MAEAGGGYAASVGEIARRLEASGIEYMLVGAGAFGIYTLPRTTYDVDIVVGDDAQKLAKLMASLSQVEETRDTFFSQRAFIVELGTLATPVELFVASHWLTVQALKRRRVETVHGARVPVATPEDLLLMKAVVASDPARAAFKRATDLSDLGRLVSAGLPLDVAYISENSKRLGGGAARILRDAGLDLDSAR